MRSGPLPSPQHQRLLAAVVLWLCGGSFLLITTLVPAHTNLLGWSPAFWLLLAPLVVLLALEPGLPRALVARRARRVAPVQGANWH